MKSGSDISAGTHGNYMDAPIFISRPGCVVL